MISVKYTWLCLMGGLAGSSPALIPQAANRQALRVQELMPNPASSASISFGGAWQHGLTSHCRQGRYCLTKSPPVRELLQSQPLERQRPFHSSPAFPAALSPLPAPPFSAMTGHQWGYGEDDGKQLEM